MKPSSDKPILVKLPFHCSPGLFQSSWSSGNGDSGPQTVGYRLGSLVSMSTCVSRLTPNPLAKGRFFVSNSSLHAAPGRTFCLAFRLFSGTSPMLRKQEQILLLISLRNCIVPWAEPPHSQYRLAKPGIGSRLPRNTQFQGNRTRWATLTLCGGQKGSLDLSARCLFVRKSFWVK